MKNKERLSNVNPLESPLADESDLGFAMRSNGRLRLSDGRYGPDREIVESLSAEFCGERVSFFGPHAGNKFFPNNVYDFLGVYQGQVEEVFRQEPVLQAIGKFRNIDGDLARRIAFLFGGLLRYGKGADAVRFTAEMTLQGGRKSGEAIAAAVAMYILSGGSLEKNSHFEGNVARMAEAIEKDPVILWATEDLGLSQVFRFRSFLGTELKEEELSEIKNLQKVFDRFPTVGAEFHFPADVAQKYPNLWERLGIFNMSQYQRGSYIGLSRNDAGVIEVRMNPSVYPITIANLNHLRLLFPELNRTFFHITIGNEEGDFHWYAGFRELLDQLRALGMLCYAAIFENVPPMGSRAEIGFGGVYLGQTVRVRKGRYEFSGRWAGEKVDSGQMSVYVGFGDNLPHLAYYLSMALTNPKIMEPFAERFGRIKTLSDALEFKPQEISGIFTEIDRRIKQNPRPWKATQAGRRMMQILNP